MFENDQPSDEPSDEPRGRTSRRDRRRAEAREEILAAAWSLARTEGLAGISLRTLGTRVGLKASSLYAYFESKAALYDAMYRQGYTDLLEWSDDWVIDDAALADPHSVLAETNAEFFRLCIDDPVRYQLLFQRVVPDWEPSADSYALALAYLDRLRSFLAAVGITDERAIDMWTAIMTGLTSQQLSNDPGGDRWSRLVDDAVAMFFQHYPPTTSGSHTSDRRDPRRSVSTNIPKETSR